MLFRSAVYAAELRTVYDVIVVSVEDYEYGGKPLGRHLANMLGGGRNLVPPEVFFARFDLLTRSTSGDYDGDRAEAYWLPEFVEHFRNADPSRGFGSDEEQALRLNEDTRTEQTRVETFLQRIPGDASDEYRIHALQRFLLSGLQNLYAVGSISEMWLKSAYMHGYDNASTIHLGQL